MKYILTRSQEVKPNFWMLAVMLLFIFLILKPLLFPKKNNSPKEHFGSFYALPYAMHKNKEDYYPKNSSLLFSNNKCCKSCCKNLWPLPFDVDGSDTCKNGKEKYVSSNYTCQGENGAGCVCVNKYEANLLDRRGNNKLIGPRIIFPYDGVEPVPIDHFKPCNGNGNEEHGEEEEQGEEQGEEDGEEEEHGEEEDGEEEDGEEEDGEEEDGEEEDGEEEYGEEEEIVGIADGTENFSMLDW